jgi:hypothetical protein
MQRYPQRIIWVGLLLSTGGPSVAEGADCDTILDVSPQTDLTVASITAGRVHFVKDSSDNPSCPYAAALCRSKVYLVKGNLVILTKGWNDFVCAIFPSPKGHEWTGWLPSSSVARRPGVSPGQSGTG